MQTKINFSMIRKLNLLYYFAQRLPNKEVDFRKTQGSGKILNYLITHSLEQSGIEEKDILKRTELDIIVAGLNSKINNLNSITGDHIQAYVNENRDKLICRILELGDENGREIGSLGEGIQYAFNILLQIIEIIHNVKSSRKEEDFLERLIIDDSGNKLFPLFIALDEPEIHQHPYRQRSLTKKIHQLIDNENSAFIDLLRELFDIDGITGQIFISTHSPNILLNDYKQFIRIYKTETQEDKLQIVSGVKVNLEDNVFKHLLHGFVYLKEAMFSRCIIMVEGDTELGALPVFAKRMNVDLDEMGIGIVKLDGAASIKNCMKLYKSFGIYAIAIIDRDMYSNYSGMANVYFTDKNDYEEDIYDSFKFYDYLDYNKAIGKLNAFIGIFNRYDIEFNIADFLSDVRSLMIENQLQEQIMADIRENELLELKNIKNAAKSALLSEHVTEIPNSFQRVISMLCTEVS